MSNIETFTAVRACAIAILGGAVLTACDVTAGNGLVVDWRSVKCGEHMETDGDAAAVAQLFVALVGPEAALASVSDEPPAPLPPAVTAFMRGANGGRRRQFEVGGFVVQVEPDENDAAQAAFVEKLARFAAHCGKV